VNGSDRVFFIVRSLLISPLADPWVIMAGEKRAGVKRTADAQNPIM
jgi:hypothetical protein